MVFKAVDFDSPEPDRLYRSMFTLIATIVLTAFTASTTADEVWNGLVASWDLDTSTHFFELPTKLEEAESQGWTFVSGVDAAHSIVPLGFRGDPTLILLFKNCQVVGVQISIPVEEMYKVGQPMKWGEIDAVITKTINNTLFYTLTTYFYKDELTGTRRLWFQEKDRLLEIPTNASLVPYETDYFLHKCVPTMGIHYHTWTTTMNCTYVYPWFLLENEGVIKGVGIQGLGQIPSIGERTWWETVGLNGLYTIMDDPPTCLVDGIPRFGVLSLHIWFFNGPKNITCN